MRDFQDSLPQVQAGWVTTLLYKTVEHVIHGGLLVPILLDLSSQIVHGQLG